MFIKNFDAYSSTPCYSMLLTDDAVKEGTEAVASSLTKEVFASLAKSRVPHLWWNSDQYYTLP